jgi:hypothetical protein
MRIRLRIAGTAGALFSVGLLLFTGVSALAANVTQSYSSEGETLYNGMIVSLADDSADKVQPLDKAAAKDMLGVVTAANDAPFSLAQVSNQQQVYVATAGQYNVLVSTQEGRIKKGDFITISSLHGIGMKATNDDEIIIGKALASFDGQTAVDGTTTVKTSGGGTRTVPLGHILVDISVAHNPFFKTDKTDGVPSFLAAAASAVTDRPVGAVRIYAALLVLLACLALAGFVIYAGVRNGMVAIGRNPLAKSSVMRNLVQVVLISLIVFIIGLVAVYLLLKV